MRNRPGRELEREGRKKLNGDREFREKKYGDECRFSYPRFPSPNTIITKPLKVGFR